MIPLSIFTSGLNFPFLDILLILLGSLSKKKTHPEEKIHAKSNWLNFPSAQCWEANLSSFCQLAGILITGCFQDQSKPFNCKFSGAYWHLKHSPWQKQKSEMSLILLPSILLGGQFNMFLINSESKASHPEREESICNSLVKKCWGISTYNFHG